MLRVTPPFPFLSTPHHTPYLLSTPSTSLSPLPDSALPRSPPKMMNILAISLLLSSLAASGVWSPPSNKPPDETNHHLLKEGHRLIVVEYERLLPPSPPPTPTSVPSPIPSTSSLIQEARDKLHEAASVLPNVGQGVSTPKEAELPSTHHAKDRICDVYGVCRDTITGLFGKSKEKVAYLKDDAKEAAAELKEGAREKASEVGEELKSNATHFAESTARVAGEAKRNATDILRRAREVLYDAVTYVCGVGGLPGTAVVHLLAFATAYGTCMWVTFVSSHVLAGALPRQQFGVVQSRLYPVYFRAVAYSVGMALLSYYYGVGRRQTVPERWQSYNLLAALGMVLANMLFLEPKATKVMFESMKLEKEEGRGRDMADIVGETAAQETPTAFSTRRAVDQEAVKSSLAKLHVKLKRLNSYSSLLNIMTLMGLTWHLVHLAWRLTC